MLSVGSITAPGLSSVVLGRQAFVHRIAFLHPQRQQLFVPGLRHRYPARFAGGDSFQVGQERRAHRVWVDERVLRRAAETFEALQAA
jgi:hypothetical protein